MLQLSVRCTGKIESKIKHSVKRKNSKISENGTTSYSYKNVI